MSRALLNLQSLKWRAKDLFLKIALKTSVNWLLSGYRHKDIFYKEERRTEVIPSQARQKKK